MKPIVLLVAATAVVLVAAGAGLGLAGVGLGPTLLVAWLILATAHGAGVHLDGRRRGQDTGGWAIGAAAFGPLVVGPYLASAYGAWAVAWGSFYVGLVSLLAGAGFLAAAWLTPICALPRP